MQLCIPITPNYAFLQRYRHRIYFPWIKRNEKHENPMNSLFLALWKDDFLLTKVNRNSLIFVPFCTRKLCAVLILRIRIFYYHQNFNIVVVMVPWCEALFWCNAKFAIFKERISFYYSQRTLASTSSDDVLNWKFRSKIQHIHRLMYD